MQRPHNDSSTRMNRCHPERERGVWAGGGTLWRPTRPDPSLTLGMTSVLHSKHGKRIIHGGPIVLGPDRSNGNAAVLVCDCRHVCRAGSWRRHHGVAAVRLSPAISKVVS